MLRERPGVCFSSKRITFQSVPVFFSAFLRSSLWRGLFGQARLYFMSLFYKAEGYSKTSPYGVNRLRTWAPYCLVQLAHCTHPDINNKNKKKKNRTLWPCLPHKRDHVTVFILLWKSIWWKCNMCSRMQGRRSFCDVCALPSQVAVNTNSNPILSLFSLAWNLAVWSLEKTLCWAKFF